jgi:hypothetical protein
MKDYGYAEVRYGPNKKPKKEIIEIDLGELRLAVQSVQRAMRALRGDNDVDAYAELHDANDILRPIVWPELYREEKE